MVVQTETFGTDTKMTIYVKQSGSWERIQETHIKDGGTWKNSDQSVSIKDGVTWRQVYDNGSQEYTTAGSSSFTIPEGVHTLKVSACGAGGGGGGGYYNVSGQGGGGGGYVKEAFVAVTPGTSLSVTVGSGGAGDLLDYPGSSTDGYGGNGTATTITGTGVSITLNGGNGGSGGYEYPYQGNVQGAGGTVSGVTGNTGQRGGFSQSYGYGGASINGALLEKFGTNNGYHSSTCYVGLYGDDSGMSGYGTGGGGRPDCGSDGRGGTGAAGYVKLEWGDWSYDTSSQSYTTGSGSFTVPANVTKLSVDMCGAGGGGGGGSDYGSGGGGSGGWYTNEVVNVTPGQVLSYSIGSGGTGSSTGAAGGNTTFGSLTCTGGAGGSRGSWGNSGTPNGVDGQNGSLYTGAGGVAGQGGTSPHGSGGKGGIGGGPGSTGPAGSAGSGYGSGGGGGCNNANGGNGTGGYIKIRW